MHAKFQRSSLFKFHSDASPSLLSNAIHRHTLTVLSSFSLRYLELGGQNKDKVITQAKVICPTTCHKRCYLLAASYCLVAANAKPFVYSATAGTFADGGNTLISAMMMFLGNDQKVYILDKAEANPTQINGHPAWGAVWDIATQTTTVMDVRTNTFCSSGMHLPNGSFVTFGGNGAVGPGASQGSQPNPGNFTSAWDATYQDFDGAKAMRILNPCVDGDDFTSSQCAWYDEPTVLSMKSGRWYSAAEATGDGSVVIIGGFAAGGYVNRKYPNDDPIYEHNASVPTYEYYPPRSEAPPLFNFLGQTSGLNAYVHTFLMPSGKMFIQANLSSVLWDHEANIETPLPDMPNGVIRVYPASGATAMLPLTPANNYTPTVLFCGGSDMPDEAWGNYTYPFIDTWNYPASQDCQRITPEPQDGSAPTYVQDDDMLEGRTMGQFIALPDGTMLVINGGLNGTAGYSNLGTLTSPSFSLMPLGESLAAGPVLTPALYNPNAAPGSRWSRPAEFQASKIPRLYHSSAILLPDASVLVAGSNPNLDYNVTTIFPTTYAAEIFYPPYFSAGTRPVPSGVPSNLTYGGNSFDITIPASSYSGSANDAADNTTVVLIRGGFTTHAMNMGQRHLQLNSTSTVNSDGSIILHVAQMPPNPNVFQPGPALLFVNVNGIPSNGTYVIVGNGQIGTQPTSPASSLPSNVRLSGVSGSASNTSSSGSTTSSTASFDSSGRSGHLGAIIGAIAGGLAVFVVLGACFVVVMRKKKQTQTSGRAPVIAGAGARAMGENRRSDASTFAPLQQNYSHTWNASTASFDNTPYTDSPAPTPHYHQAQHPYANAGQGY